ncbi:hypothetical protein PPSIR1_07628 [Plesiocystis pacifica SIR-1]|uniref:Uncharacterized protein n=1 Tax=Plesiocystis pacifica SIR-1 TaxID=391625 RepID=A6GD47_9BACT|nr:hypothetical protein [Plesiocystis pacifica]EDM76205.1 hypothetical protein PPSIR1_07628 [Plesiocystis pacifica SIR-1]
MELTRPTESEARAGLRAIKTVLTLEAPINPIEAKLIAAAQRHVLRSQVDVDALAPIEPAELAALVTRSGVREQLMTGMIVAAFTSGDARPRQVEAIEAFRAALDVDLPELADLRLLIEGRLTLLRFDVLRRMYIGEALGEIWRSEGVRGLVDRLARFRGWREEPELAARYLALGELPEGTLGRAYFDHCREGGFAFPGERYGAPEAIAVHDMAHVLGDYGTDAAGELRVAAFTAGFRKREQTLSILLFALAQFDLGVAMVPVAEPELGNLDAEAFLEAFARGAGMRVDLFDGWDMWAVVDQPLEVLRERYGI